MTKKSRGFLSERLRDCNAAPRVADDLSHEHLDSLPGVVSLLSGQYLRRVAASTVRTKDLVSSLRLPVGRELP